MSSPKGIFSIAEDEARRPVDGVVSRSSFGIAAYAGVLAWSLALSGVGIFAASLLVVGAPVLACVAIVWLVDRHEREPLHLMALTFLWGAGPAVLVASLANAVPLTLGVPLAAVAIGVAPVVEEGVKAFGVVRVAEHHRHEFDGLLDGLVYGSIVGFGFSLMEDLSYAVEAYGESGWSGWFATAVGRGLVVTGHSAYSACFGVALGLARYARSTSVRRWAPAAGLTAGIVLHALHNALTSGVLGSPYLAAVGVNWMTNVAWIALVVWAVRRESRLIRDALQGEVERGVLSAADARAAGSYRARFAAWRESWHTHRTLRWELHETAAELALALRRRDVERRVSPPDASARSSVADVDPGHAPSDNDRLIEQRRERCLRLRHQLASDLRDCSRIT